MSFSGRKRECIVGQVIEQMADRLDTSVDEPVFRPVPKGGASSGLGRREWFGLHLACFLLVSWNLLAVNLSRSPSHLWFWPWVAGWGIALVIHMVLLLAVPKNRLIRLLGSVL
jgi:hypothetical protein